MVRAALAAHDICAVYRLLQAAGYAQKQIAAWTGQSQPEVSAILHGRRVISYAVLARIADGLGIPRGYLGLSWCGCPNGGPEAADGVDGADQPANAEMVADLGSGGSGVVR